MKNQRNDMNFIVNDNVVRQIKIDCGSFKECEKSIFESGPSLV